METKVAVKFTDVNGKETKKFVPLQDSNNPKESMLNPFQNIKELDALYSYHERVETKELVQITARKLLGRPRSKWVENITGVVLLRSIQTASDMKRGKLRLMLPSLKLGMSENITKVTSSQSMMTRNGPDQ